MKLHLEQLGLQPQCLGRVWAWVGAELLLFWPWSDFAAFSYAGAGGPFSPDRCTLADAGAM